MCVPLFLSENACIHIPFWFSFALKTGFVFSLSSGSSGSKVRKHETDKLHSLIFSFAFYLWSFFWNVKTHIHETEKKTVKFFWFTCSGHIHLYHRATFMYERAFTAAPFTLNNLWSTSRNKTKRKKMTSNLKIKIGKFNWNYIQFGS